MSAVQFDVLGPLQIRRDTVLLPVTGLKNRTVISCLALHPEELIDVRTLLRAGWGDPPPRSAVHQIRKIISSLRSTLEDGWDTVSTFQEGYLLRVPHELSDVARFSRLHAKVMSGDLTTQEDLACAYDALALWRGRPCEGAEPRGCEGRMAELIEQHRALLAKAYRAFAEHGRENELVAILQTAARIHGEPVHETGDASRAMPAADRREHRPAVPSTLAQPEPVTTFGPRCLPRDLRDFSGRVDEIDRLESILLSPRPGPAVATVHGMGGVGKTALAVKVAHRIAAQFPDGQLFVSLNDSSSPGTHSVRNTAGALLSQLGVPDEEIPSSEEGRLARWRAQTAGRRLVIVFDDAACAAQVEPLMPASRSACIVTSRIDLTAIDGAHYLRLEVPSDEQCVEMLRNMLAGRHVDDDMDAAISLIHRFDNLPLALRLVTARLATREFVTLRDLARSLDDSTCPGGELDMPGRSLLGRLNSSLESMERFDLDRFLRLSLLPAPELDETAVAAALGLSTEQARRTCRRFTDRALLQRVGAGAYRIHPLLTQAAALHVPANLSVEDQRRVVADVLKYYRSSVGLIGSARVSPPPGPNPELVFATLTRAADLARDLDLQGPFVDLCLAWERPVSLHLDTDQQQRVWNLALDAATDHPDPSTRGNILLAAARCLWHRNAVREGMASAMRAWEEAERTDDYLLRVRSLLWCSSFSWLNRDVLAGLRHLRRAKALLGDCRRQVGESETRRAAMEITSNRAALLALRGDYNTSARLSQQVLGSIDLDPRVKIMARVTYAASQHGLSRYGEALTAGAAALREANQIRSAYGRALALQQKAATLRCLARPDEATAAAEEGRSMACETGSARIVVELTAFLDDKLRARCDVSTDGVERRQP